MIKLSIVEPAKGSDNCASSKWAEDGGRLEMDELRGRKGWRMKRGGRRRESRSKVVRSGDREGESGYANDELMAVGNILCGSS